MTRFQSTLSLRRATNSSIIFYIFKLFQSTLSLRRATLLSLRRAAVGRFQSTLSLRRATSDHAFPFAGQGISIHALLAESDTACFASAPRRPGISIHALLAESDCPPCHFPCQVNNFNPRSPCGERRRAFWAASKAIIFQSTLSLRRATRAMISTCSPDTDFNPRSPCGERPLRSGNNHQTHEFQSTLSLRRATSGKSRSLKGFGISIHALLAESDRATREKSRNPS